MNKYRIKASGFALLLTLFGIIVIFPILIGINNLFIKFNIERLIRVISVGGVFCFFYVYLRSNQIIFTDNELIIKGWIPIINKSNKSSTKSSLKRLKKYKIQLSDIDYIWFGMQSQLTRHLTKNNKNTLPLIKISFEANQKATPLMAIFCRHDNQIFVVNTKFYSCENYLRLFQKLREINIKHIEE
jgi:hypothetical protein